MVPTLAPHAASKIWESHVPEDIPCVIPRPKSHYGDANGVCVWGAFADVAGAASSVRVVVALKAETVYSTSAAKSTAAASTGLCDLFRHSQLNAHRLGSTGGQDTGLRAPHVTLLNEGS